MQHTVTGARSARTAAGTEETRTVTAKAATAAKRRKDILFSPDGRVRRRAHTNCVAARREATRKVVSGKNRRGAGSRGAGRGSARKSQAARGHGRKGCFQRGRKKARRGRRPGERDERSGGRNRRGRGGPLRRRNQFAATGARKCPARAQSRAVHPVRGGHRRRDGAAGMGTDYFAGSSRGALGNDHGCHRAAGEAANEARGRGGGNGENSQQ